MVRLIAVQQDSIYSIISRYDEIIYAWLLVFELVFPVFYLLLGVKLMLALRLFRYVRMIVQLILNMKKQSLTEKDLFFQFIRQLNKDNFKEATKLLIRFINTNYYNEFEFLKRRVESIKALESTKSSSITQIYSLERQIDKLNNKIVALQQKKIDKAEIKEDVMKKNQMTNCLLQSNFERTIQLAKKSKQVKMQHIAEQLQEYRWFKLQLGNSSLSSTNSKKDLELSPTGKIFKTMLVNNRPIKYQMNKYLNNALQSILSKERNSLKLPNQYFTESCCEAMDRFVVFIDSLRGIKTLDEQYNLKKIICASQQIGFKINRQNKDFNQQFDGFLQYVVDHFKPTNEDYGLGLTIKRVQSQSNEVQTNRSIIYARLSENINKLIKDFDISSTDELVVTQNLNSYMTLITLYKNILFKVKGFEDSIANHKEIISNNMTESSSIQMKLYKLNQEVQARIPTINNLRISLVAYDDNVSLFENNFLLLLNEFDKYKTASNNQPQEIKYNRNAYKSQNEEEQNCLIKIEPQQSPVNQMERITKQVERLTSLNHELVKNNQYLKETFEQEYKIKDMQKQVNQSLVSKIKILEGVQSCIIHTPYVDEHSDWIALQQGIKELSIENEKLKNVLQQRQIQIQQFKKYQIQTIMKMQQKEKQIKQWKQKHHKLRQELEELNETQEKLHYILQQQEKYINQKKSPKKQRHVQTKVEQSEGQKPQILKPVDKITISTQISQIIQTQSTNQQRTDQQHISFQSNPDKNKIEQLQKIICSLRQQVLQKQKQHLQIRSKDKKRFESIYSDLQNQKQYLQVKLNEVSIRSVAFNQQNIKNIHLFPPGFIFDQSDQQQRLFLIENLISCVGPIKKTRLLYRADNYNKTNFHKYFDKHKHVVFIFKTIYGKLIAGYSEEAFDPNGVKKAYGMILSLWAKKVFAIKEKKAIGYDDYFAIFGNSELRIKSLEFKLFSNFGIANGYYDSRGEKVHSILGQEKQREVDLSQYEIYALDLET